MAQNSHAVLHILMRVFVACALMFPSDLDDDFLDLLSDNDHGDVAPKTRTKPKIQLRTGQGSKSSEGSSLDGKPITSEGGVNNNEGGGKGEGLSQELDRPKPSRGKSEAEKWEDLDGESKTREKGKADALKLDSSLKQQRPTDSTMSVKGLNQSSTVDSFSSSKIDFSEDGDDLLSGMGLDDGTTSKHFGARRGSKIDELLGTAARKATGGPLSKSEKSGIRNAKLPKSTAESGEVEEEKEDYQFGGYLPSAAVDGGSLKPRRRHSSDDALTSRPSTAPVKKSVRFADMVETSDRPSSSPAVTEPPKPSLKGARRSTSVGRPKEGGEASRKPNSPPGVESEGAAEQQEGVIHSGSSLVRDGKQSDGEFLSTER